MAKRWYVVHAYSGYEKQVMRSLKERVKLYGMEDKFGEILVPTEEVVEIKNGQKRRSERKFFPGYVLVQMDMEEDSWHLIKDTPRVLGFIGGTADKPQPITKKKRTLFFSVFRKVVTSHVRRRCSSQVKWFALLMAPLPTSMVWSKKLITRRAVCRWR